MLLRKLASVARLLRSGAPVQELVLKVRENLRALRLAAQGGKPLTYRHENGFGFVVLPDVPETRSIYLTGQRYEKTESQIVCGWLSPGDVALDCGANVGLMTALMASRVGPDGCVAAVEASPHSCKKLEKVVNTLGLRQVRIYNLCVCDHDRGILFQNSVAHSEANAILSDHDLRDSSSVRVDSITLDELVVKLGAVPPSLIKLDIEGAEPLALKGAGRLFSSADLPLLMIEVYPRGLQRLQFAPMDIFDQLPADRYEFWHVNFSDPNPAPEFPTGVPFYLPDPRAHPWPLHTNLIAVPKAGAFAGRRSRIQHLLPARQS